MASTIASTLPSHSENVDEELHRVTLALAAVFSPHSNQAASQQWFEQRQLADRYLTSFQNTAISWMVCDRLLQESDAPNNSQESVLQHQRRFFAAQTLHTKCRTDVHELPPDSLPSLRDSLLNHLQRFASADAALPNRLAMAIAALSVQMGWFNIVTDLLNNVSNVLPIILILRALPEECASDRLLLVEDNNRYVMRDHLVTAANIVLSFLHAQIQQHGKQQRVLQTLYGWIRYVPIHATVLAESPLLETTVQALTQHEFLEYAADVVVELLRMYPSHHYGNEPLVQKLVPLLSQLPLDDVLRSDDEDLLRAYCRVVTEMGESYMSLILSHQYKEASQLVEWVLRCSSIPNVEIATITLHFWYRMVMDLESTDPYDWRQELVDVYSPHLLQLVDICASTLMKYPNDINDVPTDWVDDIHRHRFYVSETVEDCCRLLGGHQVIQRLGNLFHQEVQKATGRHQTDWQGLESCMACISAIHRFVPSDESELLPYIFRLIPQLPPEIAPLRFTASKTIGKFASWLAAHSDLLQPLLPYLAGGLVIPDCAPAAAVAIKELCECSNQSFAMAEPVLHLYQDITSEPGRIEVDNEMHILEGVCRALSRQMHDKGEQGSIYLTRLAQPIGNRLSAYVSDSNTPSRKIIPEIDRLTVIAQYLVIPTTSHGNHPMVELISSIWDFLAIATDRFPTDNMLAESICRLHKHSLRNCGAAAYTPMVNSLMKQMVRSFERTHQSPFLYAASICITEYGHDASYADRLHAMITALSQTVFSFLRSLEDFVNYPDVVEEFFYLAGRMISHCPEPLIKSALLQSLLQCATVGMQLDHPGANKGTMKFLENTVSYGLSLREQNKPEYQTALGQVLSTEGQAIVSNLVRGMIGELPTYSNHIPEILWKLNLLCPGILAQWLTRAFDSVSLPDRAKNELMGALDKGLARDEFSLAVRSFENACQRELRFNKFRDVPRRN